MAAQLCLYASRIYSRCAYATLPMALVKRRREEDIRRLRPVVSNEGIVRRALKVEILEVDIGEAVTRGRQVDQPSSCADQRRDAVDEDKVAQVIGAELRFIANRAYGRTVWPLLRHLR